MRRVPRGLYLVRWVRVKGRVRLAVGVGVCNLLGSNYNLNHNPNVQGDNIITNMKVQYHTSCCDNIPLTLDISTECIPELETVDDDRDNLRVNWSKLSAAIVEEYTRNTS